MNCFKMEYLAVPVRVVLMCAYMVVVVVHAQVAEPEPKVDGPNSETNVESGPTNPKEGYRDSTWTMWIDVDKPTGDGDIETITQIKLSGWDDVCDGTHVAGAQCRQVVSYPNDAEIFQNRRTTPAGDRLKTPCNEHGLECQNIDQVSGRCHNYEIRFLCVTETTEDDSMNIFGLIDYRIFLIIALVPIAVLILRLWCAVVERRRQMLRRRAIQRDTTADDPHDEFSRPPPSYSEVFPNDSDMNIHTIGSHRGTPTKTSVCELCRKEIVERSCDENTSRGVTEHSNSGYEDGDDGGHVTSEQSDIRISVSDLDTTCISSRHHCHCHCNQSHQPESLHSCHCDHTSGCGPNSLDAFHIPGMHRQPIRRNSTQTSINSTNLPSYEEALDIINHNSSE